MEIKKRLPASRRTTVALIGMGLFCSLALQATTTLPPVVVTAPRVGGGEIICRGMQCADVLGGMQEALPPYPTQDDQMPQGDVAIDGNAFCQYLNQNKPSGCSLNSPPASPGITVPGQTAWAPNGCGTGPTQNWFLEKIVSYGFGDVYSGSLNAPYPGVSFLSACNNHDECWGTASDRRWCDISFRDSMVTACDAISNTSGWGSCQGLASAYHAAVSGDHATSNYNESAADRSCALWASDMRENGCTP